MRREIINGKSLFDLAGKVSIDPYGRARNGLMGWIQEGKGHPMIENAISGLADGEVSKVVHTSKGYHLITILERRPGETRSFAAIRDKVKQVYFSNKLTAYLQQLQKNTRGLETHRPKANKK